MFVSAGAQMMIVPVAPVSKIASEDVGWIDVGVAGRLIW